MTYAFSINGGAERSLTLHVETTRVLALHSRASVAVDLGVAPGDFTVVTPPDTTAPTFTTLPTPQGGTMLVSGINGVASEPVVAQLRATKSKTPEQVSPYTLTPSVNINVTMPVTDDGTYELWIRVRDEAGNVSAGGAWTSIGTALVIPDFGG